MENTFNSPQRQSLVGIIVLFFDTLRLYLKVFGPILIGLLVKFDELNKLYLTLGILLIFVVVALISFLKYQNFTFYIDVENEEFIISEGVFNKTKTTFQLNKIQQVNINQSLIQRVIGVFELEVDTAGSTNKEVKIRAISHSLALSLKAHLLDNEKNNKNLSTKEVTTAIDDFESATPFIKISFISLLKVGITSNYIKSLALMILFFITATDYVNKFTGYDILKDGEVEKYVNRSALVKSFLVLLLFLFVLVLVINIFRIAVSYFDYKITKQKGSLLLSFGLINTKSIIIKSEKVQITSISRNYFQKKMNISEMKITQTTSGEKENRSTYIETPGCNSHEKNEILKLLFHQIPKKEMELLPNYRKLVFAIFLIIVLPICAFVIVANSIQEVTEFAWVTPIYVTFVGLVLYFGFRNYRLFISDDFIIKQSGAWDIRDEILAIEKIQAITTSQLFWHKSADIGYLTLHTAGGNIGFQLGNYTTIKQYVNLWLYKMETSDSNWM